jgi:hypothetical protein
MEKKNRREFLADLGITLGAITIGRTIVGAAPPDGGGKPGAPRVDKPSGLKREIDFRYAPARWQSTYCFPDDPHKSLVGKHGELLIGHPGMGADYNHFPHVVSVGLHQMPEGEYVEQRLEAPGIPIITTKLAWTDLTAVLTSFATNKSGEGRVDNLLVEFLPAGKNDVECSPEIVITSTNTFSTEIVDESSSSRHRLGIAKLEGAQTPFFAVDSPIESATGDGSYRFKLQSGILKSGGKTTFFIRFPQEGQPLDKLKGGFGRVDDLLKGAREFWLEWKPFEGKVDWKLPGEYQDFLVASARNIVEAKELKNGKQVFEVGPTVYRGMWVVDGAFLIEAARYLGNDQEAQEGLEAIWNIQDPSGGFTAGAGEAHWKDTAVAVYALVRQAELSQNWDFFHETYPDAHKAMMYLRGLVAKTEKDGTANGKYGLLPRGFADSGIGGIRSELTNSLWLWVGLKKLDEAAQRFFLPKRQDIREFLTAMTLRIPAAAREEMRQHPKGFSYLPMLMKDDPQWLESDVRKQPRPQAAQIYLSQAIYPGLLLPPENGIVKGHIELMKAVMAEDIPAETGWLSNEAVWPYNAPIAAQVFLWAGLRDLARKTFIGFLNHASPLYAWREEQSLKSSKTEQYIGDMPHNWASAECIRYLRHMLVLEDGDSLRLFTGLGAGELAAKEPIALTYSPTRFGRVSVTHEPVENRRWRTTFKREDFDPKTMPSMSDVILPRKLPPNIQFDSVTGTRAIKNGPEVFIRGDVTSWEATWIDFSK